MTSAASVEGRERVRVFCALPLPEETLDHIVEWQREALSGAREARIVPRENLHVTLAFLGHRPVGEVAGIVEEMRSAAVEAERPVLAYSRYRETRSVGMLVLEDEQDRASIFAGDLHGRLERLGVYERETRPWLPHVTVLRFRRPPDLSPPPPDLGPVSPSEVALYHSVLRRSGAQYEILESVALGG